MLKFAHDVIILKKLLFSEKQFSCSSTYILKIYLANFQVDFRGEKPTSYINATVFYEGIEFSSSYNVE
jgi:hypothetical protein